MTGAATAVQAGGPVARCSSCRAAIWWGLTAAGKRMPLDPQPADDGNVVIDQDGPGPGPRVRVLRKDEAVHPDTPRYLAHFVRCPAADRFRKRSALSAALVDKTRATLGGAR